mgnify:CR=1 FL=1
MVLLPVHFIFLITDWFIYEIEIAALVFDLLFLWLCFFNYRTLNKIMVGVQCALYPIAFLIALTHLKRVVTEIDSWPPILLYLIQYIFVYPVSALYIADRLYKHYMQQHIHKVNKNKKTLKGRAKM